MDATSFVGRERELARLTALLGSARLVTVIGTAGVGKTRLARRAAGRIVSRFADGVCEVELSALSDPDLLPNTVAARLGLTEGNADSARHALLSFLRDRQVLLILDTCEHLIDACAQLAETILQETSAVALLTTSRQPLDIAGENVCPVAPFPVTGRDAVRLFADRAAAAVPGFAVTAASQEDVVRICRRVDGIPLAIELAAARLRSLPLRELARRMETASMLDGDPGHPNIPGQNRPRDRHRTLHAAIRWSYDLCSPAEKALWERLSVFAGPFCIRAAEDVCAGTGLPRAEVLPAIVGLVDKSVLVRDSPADGPHGRYRLLDTIREFGARQLAASGDNAGNGAAVRRRLAARYLAKARAFADHLLDDDQMERFRELRGEHDSIRAALAWALDSPEAPAGLSTELGLTLYFYWHVAGRYQEGVHWLDKVLRRLIAPSPERAILLGMHCSLATTGGRAPLAVTTGRESVRVAAEVGDAHASARARVYLMHALTLTGEFAEAEETGIDAERRLTANDDRNGLVFLSVYMAHLYQLTGNFQGSLDWYERGIQMLGPGEERWLHSWLHLIGGFTLAQMPGRQAESVTPWRLALQAKYDIGDIVGTAFVLEAFALIAYGAGRHVRTAWLGGAADPLWQRAGARLAGNPVLENLHQTVMDQVREALGAQRFNQIFTAARLHPLGPTVAFAISDADDPPGQRPGAGPGTRAAGPGTRAAATPSKLTRREQEIAVLAAQGMTAKAIADRMVISKRTVDAHLGHIYAKLGISSRAGLAGWLGQRVGQRDTPQD